MNADFVAYGLEVIGIALTIYFGVKATRPKN